MTIFRTSNTDPYFNLASEEYLIDNMKGDVFMLWINAPVVVIGRNQNAYAELDRGFIEEHGIKVVRRLSGGGAVFTTSETSISPLSSTTTARISTLPASHPR